MVSGSKTSEELMVGSAFTVVLSKLATLSQKNNENQKTDTRKVLSGAAMASNFGGITPICRCGGIRIC